ncbi:MAG: ChbG/HpnK family deacetylase, partial [Chlorobi bacterium]|nr:ChbG/HpnK family deacetylase [Chlorobiota bacterium]
TVGYAGTGNKTNPKNWERILENLPDGTYEIYCHPAYPDETLHRWATYTRDRAKELEILRNPRLTEIARKRDIELISFYQI